MTEKEALDFIYGQRKFAKSSGFERIEALLNELGNPEKKLSFVHVAGTNGKGSVSTMVSYVLTSAGYRTGLFTSPFVVSFRERIQIDGKYIVSESFCKITERVKTASDKIGKYGLYPTFFETVLAAALLYFEESGCQIAVLEAGIGGKDDSTNIIPAPEVAVITSVSFDHTDVLGNTLYEIAKSKSGIMKKGGVCVSFPKENGDFDFVPQQKETVKAHCEASEKEDCALVFPDISDISVIRKTVRETVFSYKGKELSMSFTGDHQLANALVALSVIGCLKEKGFFVSDKNIEDGFKKAFIPARMEVIKDDPFILIDGGHKEGCMKALKSFVMSNLQSREITAVLGFMKDKDYKKAIEIIAPCCRRIIFTLADSFRGESPDVLSECAKKLCSEVYTSEKPIEAIEKAMAFSSENSAVICAGSFYLVSEIRNFITGDTL